MMSIAYFTRLVLIPVWQVAMVAAALYFYFNSWPGCWPSILFAIAAILIPFMGYFAAAYQIRLFRRLTRIPRAGILTLLALLVTVSGFAGLLFTGLCLLPEDWRCGGGNWSTFSPENGGFSVLMPVGPISSTLTNDTAAGPVVVTQFMAEPSPVVAFGVAHNRFPANMNISNRRGMFEAMSKGVAGTEGRLLSEAKIELHGREGREWKFEEESSLTTIRAYLVGRDLYQAICVVPKGQPCLRHTQRFLDSFELSGVSEQ
jgi:hypothetical protein